jgi:hypothetical protein
LFHKSKNHKAIIKILNKITIRRKHLNLMFVAIAFIGALLLVFGAQSIIIGNATEGSTQPLISGKSIEEHRLVARSDDYALYLREDRLSILVEDVKTGSVFRSTVQDEDQSLQTAAWKTFVQSGIVLEYIKGTNLVPERVDLVKGTPEVTYTYVETGFEATVYYKDLSIGYTVGVHLNGKGLDVRLPEAKLIESSDEFKVANIYVFPFLGYSAPELHTGYMFIPDGSGALIYLEDNNGKFKQPYSEKVYGRNIGIDDAYVVSLFAGRLDPVNPSEEILAPIYAMVHTDEQMGMMAHIKSGAEVATIEAYPNGAITRYDWITSYFVYRQVYNQLTSQTSGTIPVRQKERNHFDIHIKYDFYSGEQANYVEMAKDYRTTLLDEGKLNVQDMTYHMKLDFFGSDQENWMLFKKAVTMTTTEQAADSLSELKELDVDKVLATFLGWQDKGYYGGLPLKDYKPGRSIGGKKGLEELQDKAVQLGYQLFLDVDPITINPERTFLAERQSVKKLNKQLYNDFMYRLVYQDFYYQLPSLTLKKMEGLLSKFTQNNMTNLSVRKITNTLFSHLYKGEIYDRSETLTTYKEAIDTLSQGTQLIMEKPFEVYLPYTKAITSMPIESSKYIFVDEEVPFFSIVYNGIVPMYSDYGNFMANQTMYRLKLIEQGVWPAFLITYEDPSLLINTNSSHLYSSKYDYYKSTIVDYYKEFSEIASSHQGALVENFEKQGDVSIITYDNGVKIYVNYSLEEVLIDGVNVGALSAKVGGK